LIRNIKEKFVRKYVNCVKNANLFEKKMQKSFCSLPRAEHRPLSVADILRTHSVSLVESDQKTYVGTGIYSFPA